MSKKSNQRKDDVATQKIRAFERAAKDLMTNFDDTNLHGILNCVIRGWIQDGRFTEEYRALIVQAEQEYARAQEAAAAARAPMRESPIIIDTSTI